MPTEITTQEELISLIETHEEEIIITESEGTTEIIETPVDTEVILTTEESPSNIITEGQQGPQGIQGIQGEKGDRGEHITSVVDNGDGTLTVGYGDGYTVITSDLTGPQGIQGIQGIQGDPGADGADGISAYQVAVNGGFVGTEADWLNSLVGPQGIQGEQGIQGPPGLQGDPGADGAAGLSAYQIAVNEGFVGTEAQWLASLVGPQGPTGTWEEEMPYAKKVDFIGDNVIISGKAAVGTQTSQSIWQLSRTEFGVDDDVTVTWADGDAAFDNVWDNRLTYTYS